MSRRIECSTDGCDWSFEAVVWDAVVEDMASVGPGQADHHAHGGGLARPVWPDESGHPSRFDGEGEVVECS